MSNTRMRPAPHTNKSCPTYTNKQKQIWKKNSQHALATTPQKHFWQIRVRIIWVLCWGSRLVVGCLGRGLVNAPFVTPVRVCVCERERERERKRESIFERESEGITERERERVLVGCLGLGLVNMSFVTAIRVCVCVREKECVCVREKECVWWRAVLVQCTCMCVCV